MRASVRLKHPGLYHSPRRRSGRSPNDIGNTACSGRCSRESARGTRNCCRLPTSSGLSPWFAASHRRGEHAGRCAWWPRKRSSENWFRAWAGRRFGSCSKATTSNRGGKKMWCVAELDEEYIAQMEDVLALYEKPYRSAEPVICLDEKPVSLHDDLRPSRPARPGHVAKRDNRSEEHTSELQSPDHLVCRLLLEK